MSKIAPKAISSAVSQLTSHFQIEQEQIEATPPALRGLARPNHAHRDAQLGRKREAADKQHARRAKLSADDMHMQRRRADIDRQSKCDIDVHVAGANALQAYVHRARHKDNFSRRPNFDSGAARALARLRATRQTPQAHRRRKYSY